MEVYDFVIKGDYIRKGGLFLISDNGLWVSVQKYPQIGQMSGRENFFGKISGDRISVTVGPIKILTPDSESASKVTPGWFPDPKTH